MLYKPLWARLERFICCVGSFVNAISITGRSRLAAKTFRFRRGIKQFTRGSLAPPNKTMYLMSKARMKSVVTLLYMRLISRFFKSITLAVFILVSGCSSNSVNLQNLAKSDIDLVSDQHIKKNNALIRELTVKLYKRNPKELAKMSGESINSRLNQIFIHPKDLIFSELQKKRSIEAILLGFDDDYKGDRVFALMVGLRGMLYRAYNQHTELYMLDSLDAQKLYNSARNIEILAWRLAHRRDARGKLFLLTNSTGPVANLSFERLFGKMIVTQDLLAEIIADRNQRTINKIVHSIVFLPVG